MQLIEGGPNPTRVVGRRVVSYLLDGVIGLCILGGILWFFDPNWYQATEVVNDPTSPTGETETMSSSVTVTILFLELLWFIITGAILEGLYGWSLGKLIMQIRVVRWDGRPPGPLRGLLRNVLWIVDGICGGLVALGFAVTRNDHRRVGDMVADTYVIDAVYFDHLIVRTPEGVKVGPKTVKAEDVAGPDGVGVPILRRPKEPIYEKNLDTYIVWNEQQQRLLMFDKASKTWVPVENTV